MSRLSQIHADLRRARITGRNSSGGEKDAPTGVHKAYERMQRLILPDPEALEMTLGEALERRTSAAVPKAGALPLETYGTLLGMALRKRERSHRRQYPSGGSLYPIETYLISDAVPDTAPSAFHYNPTDHALELLWNLPEDVTAADLFRNPDIDTPASTLIAFTSVWERSSAKYGDFSYILALLEAGHMSENVLLVATALGIAARPLGGFDDQALTQLLDLDPEEEQPVHMIALQ